MTIGGRTRPTVAVCLGSATSYTIIVGGHCGRELAEKPSRDRGRWRRDGVSWSRDLAAGRGSDAREAELRPHEPRNTPNYPDGWESPTGVGWIRGESR